MSAEKEKMKKAGKVQYCFVFLTVVLGIFSFFLVSGNGEKKSKIQEMNDIACSSAQQLVDGKMYGEAEFLLLHCEGTAKVWDLKKSPICESAEKRLAAIRTEQKNREFDKLCKTLLENVRAGKKDEAIMNLVHLGELSQKLNKKPEDFPDEYWEAVRGIADLYSPRK
jgi:hypothetical protein